LSEKPGPWRSKVVSVRRLRELETAERQRDELLEALHDLNSVSEKMDGVANEYWRRTLEKTRRAIAKAEGREG
jgi:hypothetical protein